MTGLAPPTPFQSAPGNLLTHTLWNGQIHDGLTYLLGPPICQVYASAAQSVASSTNATVALDTVLTDPYSAFSTAAHTWTAPFTGWWEFRAHVNWAANATGNRACWFSIGGNAVPTSETWGSTNSTVFSQQTACIAYVAAGQVVTFVIWQSSGAALSTTAASTAYAAWSVRPAHA